MQPRRNGGAGHRVHAPAAKWAASAIVAPDIEHFDEASERKLPFVLDRELCHSLLAEPGAAVESQHALIGDDAYRAECDNKTIRPCVSRHLTHPIYTHTTPVYQICNASSRHIESLRASSPLMTAPMKTSFFFW